MKTFLWTIFLIAGLSFSSHTTAQNISEDNQERMDRGVYHMNQGNYQLADNYFKLVLKNVSVLPPEICFYFGKNSYFMKSYKQSINWLNKYIELEGEKGGFFKECVSILRKAERAYIDGKSKEAVDKGLKEPQSVYEKIDCENYPLVICPICNGSGVIINEGKFGPLYSQCPYQAKTKGRMKCEDYVKFLEGNLPLGD